MNTDNSELRVAIIGCGDIAGRYDENSSDDGIYSHAGAFQSLDIPITLAIDENNKRLQEFSEVWNVTKCSQVLDELLQDYRYDLVSVCTPDSTHYDIISQILHRNPPKILWAEKPLAKTYGEAREIVNLAKQKGTGLRVTYHRRWEPSHIRLREIISKGDIGHITSATGYYVKGMIHIGTTLVDTFRFLLGEVTSSWRIPSIGRGSYFGDPSFVQILEFEDGCQAAIMGVDGHEYTFSIFELDIVGTHGRIRITDNGDIVEVYKLAPYGHYSGFNELTLGDRWTTEMKFAIKHGLQQMLDSLQNSTWKDISEGVNAMRNLEVVETSDSLLSDS